MDRKITDKEYVAEFQPIGVWVLVEKDVLPEKTNSGIILSTKGRNDSVKLSGTGVIKGLSPDGWNCFEQQHDGYWRSKFRVGDHIGFSIQTPLISPAPPQWQFIDTGDAMSTKFVVITITDIIGIFLKDEKIKKEFLNR